MSMRETSKKLGIQLQHKHFPTTGVWLPHNKVMSKFYGTTFLDVLGCARHELGDDTPSWYRSSNDLLDQVLVATGDYAFAVINKIQGPSNIAYMSMLNTGSP
jgi:hypothetical protein